MKKTFLVVMLSGLLAACADKERPPEISYDSGDFDTAVLAAEPPRPVQIVVVPEPLPLPGQLKPAPGEQPDTRQPEARIVDANTAAAVEPSAEGYINAIQVYPYTEGALYQLYTSAGGAPEVRSVLRPFHVLFLKSGQGWPEFVLAEPLILAAMIVITSLALMICLAVVYALTACFGGAETSTESERANAGLADRPTRVLAIACLMLSVLGIASGTLFAFDDPGLVGNRDFLWASGQGVLMQA